MVKLFSVQAYLSHRFNRIECEAVSQCATMSSQYLSVPLDHKKDSMDTRVSRQSATGLAILQWYLRHLSYILFLMKGHQIFLKVSL